MVRLTEELAIRRSGKHWNDFYRHNSTNFFKDRHWTGREFPELLQRSPIPGEKIHLLELGCGVGNLAFPAMELNPDLFVHACDLSHKAVELFAQRATADEASVEPVSGRCRVFQADLCSMTLANELQAGSVDLVTAVFVLSALSPDHFSLAVDNLHRAMKPGARLLFRDYCVGDLAQKRFEECSTEKKLRENLYLRQDGTMSYFFTEAMLRDIFDPSRFHCLEMERVVKIVVNRKEGKEMERVFLQAKFEKR